MKISVIGTGYVGLVTGICFANLGHDVLCLDSDTQKIHLLNQGKMPFFESHAAEYLQQALQKAKISFSSDITSAIEFAETLFIAIGTPQDADGSAELKSIFAVVRSIAEKASSYKMIVIKSTVPAGTQDLLKNEISRVLQERGLNFSFDLVSNPEFLREGNAFEDFLHPDRIIIGINSEKARVKMLEIYEVLPEQDRKIIFMTPQSSEMTKYSSNVMLAARISLMNEISRLCEKTGADFEQVKAGIAGDHRIGPHFLNAGVGYGGSCFAKDIKALTKIAQSLDVPAPLLESIERSNEEQKEYFFRKIERGLGGSFKNKKIALWGLSFKPGTDDIRNAPSLYFIEHLLKAGALVSATDPAALQQIKKSFPESTSLTLHTDPYQTLEQADCLVVLTEWDIFANADFQKVKSLLKTPLVFDGRNILLAKNLPSLGFKYFSVGKLL